MSSILKIFNIDLISKKITEYLIDDKTKVYTVTKIQHIFKDYLFKDIFKKEYFLFLFNKYKVFNNDFILLLSKIFKYSNKQQILNNYLYQHFIKNLDKKEFIIKQSNHKKTDYIDNDFISPKNRYLLYILLLYYNFDHIVLKEQYFDFVPTRFRRLYMDDLDNYKIIENNEWLYPKYILKRCLIYNDYDFKYVKTINNNKYFKRVTENLSFFYEKKLYKQIKLINKN
jgi:hypothetical protein